MVEEGVVSLHYADSYYERCTRDELTEHGVPSSAIDEAFIAQDWKKLRTTRWLILRETDWTQVNDCPLDEDMKEKWREYRAKLRRLPQDNDTPERISWPEPPEESEIITSILNQY